MKLLKKLNKYLPLFLLLVSVQVYAQTTTETKWEVSALFLGAREDVEFHQDIDNNLKEIAQIKKNPFLKISVLREKSGAPLSQGQIFNFLKKSYTQHGSKKALIIYGHGEGPDGLKGLSMFELEGLLKNLNIKFDFIWFDACFLSNLEFLFQLKTYSSYTIASEEAEFSAGMPFLSLADLPKTNEAKRAAIHLARSFIDSYSYLKEGDQRNAVSSSSATISVIDNSQFDSFMADFKFVPSLLNKLSKRDRENLKNTLTKKASMDNSSLVDLGHLLIELRALVSDQINDNRLTKLIRLLNIGSIKQLKTNMRVKIANISDDAKLVFGFNQWDNGFKDEYLDNQLFPEILRTSQFILGPKNESWPVFTFRGETMTLSPFAPGINSFQYYFVDGKSLKKLTNSKTIRRKSDVVELMPQDIQKITPGQLLVYSSYTQGVETKAERYTGINISLFDEVPSIDYLELDFNQMLKWLKM